MSDFNTEFDDARELMYDQLAEEFSDEAIETSLEDAVKNHLTQLYDNRDQLRQQAEQ